MPERSLTVTFLGNSAGLEAALKRTSAQLNGFQAAGAGMSSLGKSMTRNLTLPIVGLGLEAAKMAVKFQQSMETLHTQAGVSQSAIAGLSKGVLAMAGQVGAAPQALAQGLYHVASSLNATLPAATRYGTELRVLKIAAEGAAVGHADLTDVTNALDAAVVSGIRGVQNFSQAMGGLNSIVGAGDMTMQNLADALSTGLLAPMQTYGLSLNDVGGALATFGDNNIRGQEAATKLVSAVRIMAAPSKAAAKELATVGLSTLSLANDMRKGGLVLALQDLKNHLIASGDTASQQGLVIARSFGGRQSTGVQVLLQQLERLRVKTDQVAAGATGFGAAWAATQQTAAFKVQAGLDKMKADLTSFGNDVLPTLLSIGGTVVKDVDKVASAFTSLPKGAQDAIIKGGLVLAAIGPAMKILGLFTGGIGKLVAISSKLAAWGAASNAGGSLAAAERASSTVATMNVGTLIARSMAGVGGAGGYQPFGMGKSSTVPATAAEAAAVETSTAGGFVSSVKSGLGTALSGAMRGLMIGGIGTLVAQGIGSSIHGAVGKAISTIGSDAAIGAGLGSTFGPEGTMAGAVTGGLVGAFAHFLSADANRYGNEIAAKITAPLGKAVADRFNPMIAKSINAARDLEQAAKSADAQPGAIRGIRQVPAADLAKAKSSWFSTGWGIAEALISGLNSIKNPTGWVLLRDFRSELANTPPQARDEAAKVMVNWAGGLARNGKLPKAQLDSIIGGLESSYSGLQSYLKQHGAQSAAAIAQTFDLAAAQRKWRQSLETIRSNYGDTAIALHLTNQNILANTKRAMSDLTQTIADGTKKQRLAAMAQYDLLQTQVAEVWKRIAQGFLASTGASAAAVKGLSTLIPTPPAWMTAVKAHHTPPTVSHASRAAAATVTIPTTVPASSSAAAAVPKIPTPPAATLIPSQLVGDQTRMAQIANSLTLATNAGNIAAQQKALTAELLLERSWVTADTKTLNKVNQELANQRLSQAKHKQLLQDKLAATQELGAIESQIGSNLSSLSGLTGTGAGSFDLAPAGAGVQTPSIYDVRKAAAPHRSGEVHNHTTHNTYNIKVEQDVDLKKVWDAVERGNSHLHSRMRSAGLRGT